MARDHPAIAIGHQDRCSFRLCGTSRYARNRSRGERPRARILLAPPRRLSHPTRSWGGQATATCAQPREYVASRASRIGGRHRYALTSISIVWGGAVMTNSSPRLLIKNGTLIDGSGRDPVPNTLVVVEGNRISHMSASRGRSIRPDTPDDTVIDADGQVHLARFDRRALPHLAAPGRVAGRRSTRRAPSSAPYGRHMRSAACCAPGSPASPCPAANGSPM